VCRGALLDGGWATFAGNFFFVDVCGGEGPDGFSDGGKPGSVRGLPRQTLGGGVVVHAVRGAGLLAGEGWLGRFPEVYKLKNGAGGALTTVGPELCHQPW